MKRVCAVAALGTVVFAAGAATAQGRAPAPTDVPHCAQPIGTASIAPPAREWWTQYGLSSPEELIKLMIAKSGCLRIVDRGAGLQMRDVDRNLAAQGELQRGSNLGAGQVKVADYVIIPDVADANANQSAAGAALSGLIGNRAGGLGALMGSIQTQQATARTLLTLVNARTTEHEYVAEGTASKTNLSLGAGGFGGGIGGVGGGYSNTSIGQVIAQAYLVSFTNLVAYLQRQPSGQAAQTAPIQTYAATSPIAMHAQAAPNAAIVRNFAPGESVFPTGQRNGVWWEVDDVNGNRGWVPSVQIAPK